MRTFLEEPSIFIHFLRKNILPVDTCPQSCITEFYHTWIVIISVLDLINYSQNICTLISDITFFIFYHLLGLRGFPQPQKATNG